MVANKVQLVPEDQPNMKEVGGTMMRIWILEQKPDSDQLWVGYDLIERIAVVAQNLGEAREIAGKSQPMQPRQKGTGQHALDEPNISPWRNPDASTCREIADESDACVLAIQDPKVHVKDARVMA